MNSNTNLERWELKAGDLVRDLVTGQRAIVIDPHRLLPPNAYNVWLENDNGAWNCKPFWRRRDQLEFIP